MTNERKIICVREGSSMVSTWNEYLCVTNISTGVGRIDVCGYEALGEYQSEDEEGNELPIPKEVDGKIVIDVEDGYLVGGELDCYDDDKSMIYTVDELDAVIAWLAKLHFKVSEQMISEIKAAVS